MEKKKRNVYHLTDGVQSCYRQGKFKEHDWRFNCPFGFEQINDQCYNCKWLKTEPLSTFQATGKDAEAVSKFVRNFMPTEVLPHQDTETKETERAHVTFKNHEKEKETAQCQE